MHIIDQNLWAAGIELPEPPAAIGRYLPVLRRGRLLYLSGQLPLAGGVVRYSGCVGAQLSAQEGYAAARLAALNVLAHIRAATHAWRDLDTLLRLEGHVASAPGFYDQAQVLDGASELFADILGEHAGHTRAALACPQLPKNAAVELVVSAALK